MMLREKAMKCGIELHLEFALQDDICLVADQRKLKQIMYNLLSNAVKFTHSGGSVDVRAQRDGDFIEITVADSGMGIKGEDIPKLFQAFTQLESVYTKEYEGTGLGLALTKQLVELHGGRIWVKSAFGTGSRFSFSIPLTQAALKVVHANGSSSTVLLIDDEPLTLAAMGIALQSRGFRVLMASNGEQGLGMALHDLPDLIVLDLIMPGMNGFEVADRLRNEHSTANIPILILTAMDLSATDRARLAVNVWRTEQKGSLATQELISLVESAVGNSQPSNAGGNHDASQDTDR